MATSQLALQGKQFGKLTALEPLKERKSGHVMWRCACECEAETTVRAGSLTSDNTKSCGCHKTKVKKGNKYGQLTALERIKTDDGFMWRCECSCGNEKLVIAGNLYTGNTKSCGCLVSVREDWTEYERAQKRAMLSDGENLTYDTWRRKVKKRDNYTCQICGYEHHEKYDIIAHHIDSYQTMPDKRTLLENGDTLCKWCHNEFHAEYGQKGTTREQYVEFKERKQHSTE